MLLDLSQEAGKVVWYSHLFKNFPQLVVVFIVKGFRVVNEAEVDVFMEFSSFFYDLMDIGNLVSGSFALSKSSFTSGSSKFTYYWSLAWRILSITLLAYEMSAKKLAVFTKLCNFFHYAILKQCWIIPKRNIIFIRIIPIPLKTELLEATNLFFISMDSPILDI